MKTCTKCNVTMMLVNFPNDNRAKDGKQSRCYSCYRQYYYDNREKRKDYNKKYNAKHSSELKEYHAERYSSIKGRSIALYNSAKDRAEKFEREFTITRENVEFMLSFKICWITGIPFRMNKIENTKNNPFAPSLDRKDNNEGYTLKNTQIVCNMVNMAKSDASEIDFIAMCMAVAERNASNEAAIKRLAELRNAEL